VLVPELGLENTRRNRRWLAIFGQLAEFGGSQEQSEAVAWSVLVTLEALRRARTKRRRSAVVDDLRDDLRELLSGDQASLDRLAEIMERTYLDTK